jgi:hypothetical protein
VEQDVERPADDEVERETPPAERTAPQPEEEPRTPPDTLPPENREVM